MDSKTFLEGPFGAGKTTAAVQRMSAMLEMGARGDQLLVLVPQRIMAAPYQQALRAPGTASGGVVQVLTVGGLARRAVDLFWPLAAEKAGFAKPKSHPIFLTIETAQYYMAFIARSLIEERGYFETVSIDRNRLYSQIIDNLNKAAVVGFHHEEIGERLSEAWIGDPVQLRVYQDTQECASRFRKFCLEHNLLDFSLQIEVFSQYIWQLQEYRDYLKRSIRHIIYDNLEEDTPFAFDILEQWLPELDSGLLIFDWNGGYRTFLGADADLGYALKDSCDQELIFESSFIISSPVFSLAKVLNTTIRPEVPELVGAPFNDIEKPSQSSLQDHLDQALVYSYHQYYPQMLDCIAEEVETLVTSGGLAPSEIVILAPYLPDALRFAIVQRLEERQISTRSLRPSRTLLSEPAARCLVTLASLAYSDWNRNLERYDVAYALMEAIDGLDLVRAKLLTDIVYQKRHNTEVLGSFDNIQPEVQDRISYHLGERYEALRKWLQESQQSELEFDLFLARCFGELLSQPGYGFHHNYDAGQVAANLVESVRKFRWAAGETLARVGVDLGQEYLRMLEDGVIAAQYLGGWWTQPEDAVLIAPAYTFLMSNRPATVQFWLDVGGRGWAERLDQPLTHPHVLSRRWQRGRDWTDRDEMQVEKEALHRLVVGLLRRCRKRIYLGLSKFGEGGYESRGPLLAAFQHVLRASGEEH